jgi:hypothetical protein
MARKATANQKAKAKKLGIRVTKTVRGKRVELTAEVLKSRIAKAEARRKRAKQIANRKRARVVGKSDRSADSRIQATQPVGTRRAKKYAKIKYKIFDKNGKWTGKWKTVRRKNATSATITVWDARKGKSKKIKKYITPTSGNKYVENRKNRTDANTKSYL